MHNWNQVQPAPYDACTSSQRRLQGFEYRSGYYGLHDLRC